MSTRWTSVELDVNGESNGEVYMLEVWHQVWESTDLYLKESYSIFDC